ncbi:MIF4G domain protein [Ancylostoma caninum]|uniref:MIF4G domain protein n=1 Tax=Ancylostoma caninum TaxID=29170 RepID=A0A368G450_ANCCA|nr:MIF4G domain protein [Ancylostoma caninum]
MEWSRHRGNRIESERNNSKSCKMWQSLSISRVTFLFRKTGQVIGADPKAALKKLEDLDAKGGDSESKQQIDRALMGTINRLSEGTLVRSHQVISEYWQNHSKNDVKSCLTNIMLRLIGSPYRLQDQLLSLYALFVAHIHAFTSDEICTVIFCFFSFKLCKIQSNSFPAAYFVEVFLRDFVEQISQPQSTDDKKLENSVVFMAHLLNFHVIKMSVIVEVLQKLREHLNIDNLQLVVTLASYSYKALRRHYWTAFSEEMAAISRSSESAVFSGLPRAKFLGETLSALQKTAPTNIDMSITEHHLKLFQGLRKKNKLVSDQELGMSLDDIIHAEERGRCCDDSKICFEATSDDEDNAFERLLRLSLKGQQEREIIYVSIIMMLREKTFNPFYPMLIARFCDFDKRFAVSFPPFSTDYRVRLLILLQIEKVMVDMLSSKKKTKKKKKKGREHDVDSVGFEGSQPGSIEDVPTSERGRKQSSMHSESESDSDADLTYEQYLKEVKDKRLKLAMEGDDAEQDDIDIHRYSRLLGIKEGKKSKKLKSFANDGLDCTLISTVLCGLTSSLRVILLDLLDFCDSDNRKRILASSADQEISLSGADLSDEDDGMSGSEAGVNIEEDDISMKDDENDDDMDDVQEPSDEEGDESEDDDEDDLQEDIYGRMINRKTGQVIGADPKAALKKLEDLDAKGGDSESKQQIDRALMGTINRLSEGTLVRSLQVISEYWQNHSKNDVKSCLTNIMLRLIGSPYRLQDQLLSLYALFIAHIHAFTSDEICTSNSFPAAYFVEVFLSDFVEQISQPQSTDDKKLENSVVFMAHLLNFHVIKMSVIVEVLQKLREHLNVDNLQLVVTLASYSYKALRRHYWTAFSEEMAAISRSLESAVFSGLPRAKFLGETLSALQKTAPTNIDMSITEHHLKLFQGLRKKNKLVSDQELGMSLDDIIHAEERGRCCDDSKICFEATSDDEDNAFERLLHLSLKGQQEREIIYVSIIMMLREKTFNPFYPMLIARFCDFDKRFALTTQYALWDRIREADSLKLRARSRLADLIHHLISHETLPITVLKVVEWGTMSGAVASVIRRVFKQLSTCPMQKLRRIFTPLFNKDKNPLLSEGVRLFLTVNFPDNEVYGKIEEYFAGEA